MSQLGWEPVKSWHIEAMTEVEVDDSKALTPEQALALLRAGEQGIFEWNRMRRGATVLPSLADADLSGSLLAGADLSGVDLTHANLRGVDLFEAKLDGADLGEADLSDAHLSDASLSDATLIEAKLCRANLMGADLNRARLSYADLSEANLIGADLSGANLNRANFSGAKLVGSHLALSKLSGTTFRHADLRGAELSEAELSEADLSSADLSKADLSRALLDSTELGEARLEDTCLDAAVLTNVQLGDNHDLLVAAWEHLGLNGTSYTRSVVERGGQRLPPGRAPIAFQFQVSEALTARDLVALGTFATLDAKPRGSRVFVELLSTGQVLVVEGHGELPRAALLGALLFVLPMSQGSDRRSAEYVQLAGEPSESAAATLRTVVAETLSDDLIACAKKLAPPSLRLRPGAERERFEQLLEAGGAAGDFEMGEAEIRLFRRSPASEQAFLQALGFDDYLGVAGTARGETAS